MVDAHTSPGGLQVGSVLPVTDADTVAAITVAVLEAWPKPSAAVAPEPVNVRWRFSQRRWRDRSIPRRTWGA